MSEPSIVAVHQIEAESADGDTISIVTRNCEGRHHSISDLFKEKIVDSFVVGRVVEEKKGSKALQLKKYILHEVLPNGDLGKTFAVFIFERKSIVPAELDDFLIIHNPDISKTCFINILYLLDNKYEFQIILHPGYNTAKENKQSVQLVKFKKPVLCSFEETEKKKVSSQLPSTSIGNQRKHPLEEASNKASHARCNVRCVKKSKFLLSHDSENKARLPILIEKEHTRSSYTKLKDINSYPKVVNLFGIIISVTQGCQAQESKKHIKIYLQDESTYGKCFLLNLISDIVDVPPLHIGYILRAKNVLVQLAEEDIVGWVINGKSIATVESDLSKPVTLLTAQENSELSSEDNDRINELCEFMRLSAFKINTNTNVELESVIKEKPGQQMCTGSLNFEEEPEGDWPVTLHLSSSESDESSTHTQFVCCDDLESISGPPQDMEEICDANETEEEGEEPVPTLGEAVRTLEVVRRYLTSFDVDCTTISKVNSLEREALNVWSTSQKKLTSLLDYFMK